MKRVLSEVAAPGVSAFTVTDYARRLGVGPDKVRGWIASGQLRAVNVAADEAGRPRFRILQADADAFEANRSSRPAEPRRRPLRRPRDIESIL